MKTALALGLLAEAAASVFLVACILMALAFSGEAYRGRQAPVQMWVHFAAVVVSLLPLAATAACAWKARGAPALSVLAAPALTLLLAAPAAVGLLPLGEALGAASSKAREKEAVAQLRARAGLGEASYCELVNRDPQSGEEEMSRCRAAVDAAQGEARRREWEHFIDRGSLRSWNPFQLGLIPRWDFNTDHLPTLKPALQGWFLKAFFTDLLAEPGLLDTPAGRSRFWRLVQSAGRLKWSAEALAVFERDLRPALRKRVAAQTDWSTDGGPGDIRDAVTDDVERFGRLKSRD